jgi:hypothetical protein
MRLSKPELKNSGQIRPIQNSLFEWNTLLKGQEAADFLLAAFVFCL